MVNAKSNFYSFTSSGNFWRSDFRQFIIRLVLQRYAFFLVTLALAGFAFTFMPTSVSASGTFLDIGNGNTLGTWGSGDRKLALRFSSTTAYTVCSVGVQVSILSPATSTPRFLFLDIYEGGVTPEVGNFVDSVTLAVADVGHEFRPYSTSTIFNFSSCPFLANGVDYWFVVRPDNWNTATTSEFRWQTSSYATSSIWSFWDYGSSWADQNGVFRNGFYLSGDSSNILFTSTFSVPTTTFVSFYQSFPTSTLTCADDAYSSTTLIKIGCMFKEAGYSIVTFLIRPSTTTTNYANTAISSFQGVFPFSFLFHFADVIEGILPVDTASSSANIAMTGYIFPDGQSMDVTFISSSSLADFVGQANKDRVFSLQKHMMWIAVLLLVLKTIML